MSLPTDKQMIERVEVWPLWPILPMKKRSDEPGKPPEVGFFWNGSLDDRNNLTFYLGSIHDPSSATVTTLSRDDVLAAGWVVD